MEVESVPESVHDSFQDLVNGNGDSNSSHPVDPFPSVSLRASQKDKNATNASSTVPMEFSIDQPESDEQTLKPIEEEEGEKPRLTIRESPSMDDDEPVNSFDAKEAKLKDKETVQNMRDCFEPVRKCVEFASELFDQVLGEPDEPADDHYSNLLRQMAAEFDGMRDSAHTIAKLKDKLRLQKPGRFVSKRKPALKVSEPKVHDDDLDKSIQFGSPSRKDHSPDSPKKNSSHRKQEEPQSVIKKVSTPQKNKKLKSILDEDSMSPEVDDAKVAPVIPASRSNEDILSSSTKRATYSAVKKHANGGWKNDRSNVEEPVSSASSRWRVSGLIKPKITEIKIDSDNESDIQLYNKEKAEQSKKASEDRPGKQPGSTGRGGKKAEEVKRKTEALSGEESEGDAKASRKSSGQRKGALLTGREALDLAGAESTDDEESGKKTKKAGVAKKDSGKKSDRSDREDTEDEKQKGPGKKKSTPRAASPEDSERGDSKVKKAGRKKKSETEKDGGPSTANNSAGKNSADVEHVSSKKLGGRHSGMTLALKAVVPALRRTTAARGQREDTKSGDESDEGEKQEIPKPKKPAAAARSKKVSDGFDVEKRPAEKSTSGAKKATRKAEEESEKPTRGSGAAKEKKSDAELSQPYSSGKKSTGRGKKVVEESESEKEDQEDDEKFKKITKAKPAAKKPSDSKKRPRRDTEKGSGDEDDDAEPTTAKKAAKTAAPKNATEKQSASFGSRGGAAKNKPSAAEEEEEPKSKGAAVNGRRSNADKSGARRSGAEKEDHQPETKKGVPSASRKDAEPKLSGRRATTSTADDEPVSIKSAGNKRKNSDNALEPPTKSSRTKAQPVSKSEVDEDMVIYVTSAVDGDLKSKFVKFAEKTSAEIVADWTPQVTHVVTDNAPDKDLPQRTVRLLKAVLAGNWILGVQWIKACLSKKKLLPYDSYEIAGFSSNGELAGPASARESVSNKEVGLFKGLDFLFVENPGDKPVVEYKELVELGGGNILEEAVPGKKKKKKAFHVEDGAEVGSAAVIEIYGITKEKIKQDKDRSVYKVATSWIADCIERYQVIDA